MDSNICNFSEDSGEISWESSEEAERSFELALATPIKIRRKIKKNKITRNVNNLTLKSTSSPVLNSFPKKSRERSPSSPLLKCSSKVLDQQSPIFTPKHHETLSPSSPILKPSLKFKTSPIIQPKISPNKSNQKNHVKYLFTTELKPQASLDEIIPAVGHISAELMSSHLLKSPVMKNKCDNSEYRHVSEININVDETNLNAGNYFNTNPKLKYESLSANRVRNSMLLNSDNDPKSNQHMNELVCSETSSFSGNKTVENQNSISTNVLLTFAKRKSMKDKSLKESNKHKMNRNPSSAQETKSHTAKHKMSNIYPPKNLEVKQTPCDKENSNTGEINNVSPILSKKRQFLDIISPPDEKIVKKIKMYFDDHFSSSSNTQISIADSSQQSVNDNQISSVEILESNSPSVSQVSDVKILTEISSSRNTDSESSRKSITIKNESNDDVPKRRRKYKKDGLAGRLQTLVKKQRNQLFLWRHEMYLASNSSFIIPNTNPFKLFAILKINPEYGNYVMDAIDVAEQKECTIVLNINYECNVTVSENSFLKVFEPFQTIEMEYGTVLFDVCKFECINVKDDEK